MILTGEWLPAAELYRLGAAEAVVLPEELLPTTMALAKLISSKSPIGVHLAKESANRVEFADSKQGYRTEQDYTVQLSRYADAAEARLAYLEKRDPRFRWD